MILSLLSVAALSSAAAPEEDTVLSIVDDFFVALERADAGAFRGMVEVDAQLQGMRPGPEGVPKTQLETREPWLERLGGLEGKIVELYWDPVVNISPVGLAHVWTPYYIEYEGKTIHCGIDAFTLVKREGGWKITNLHDTRDPDGCDRLGLDGAKDRMRPVSLKPKLQGLGN